MESNEVQSVEIARVGDLRPGETRKFVVEHDGREVEAFLVNHDGNLHAWVNECRHVTMTMDWVENQFFTEDGRFILCATHGACYRPDTGECVEGPALGKALHRIPIRIDGDRVLTE